MPDSQPISSLQGTFGLEKMKIFFINGTIYAQGGTAVPGIKQAVKGVTYFIPALKPANLILSAVSKGTGLVFAENISADKALMGLQQYDGVLTRTYEKYTQMMEKGVASPEDVKEADRLYALLTATKKKEYECMMQLSKTGSAEYNTYKAKYEELCEMMKDLSA